MQRSEHRRRRRKRDFARPRKMRDSRRKQIRREHRLKTKSDDFRKRRPGKRRREKIRKTGLDICKKQYIQFIFHVKTLYLSRLKRYKPDTVNVIVG